MNKAVFLDRDGVITQEPPHYAHRLDQLALIRESGNAIRLLNENDFRVVIVSNQSGIARGYYNEEDASLFNQALREKLTEMGANIDAIYICPHHPQADIESYRMDCDCRKPKPGMLIKAASDIGIDMKNSFMVGDKLIDIEAGQRAGVSTVLVKTGWGVEELKKGNIKCDFITEDLYQAAEHILDSKSNL